MAVHQLREEPIREPLRLVAEDDVAEPPKPKPPGRSEERDQRNADIIIQATANLMILARILSARFILMLSVVGAFALAVSVAVRPSWPSFAVMALYALGVVIPLVLLESGLLGRIKN